MPLERLQGSAPSPEADARPRQDAFVLLGALRGLAVAQDLPAVTEVVRRAARALTGADGVTFVLREGNVVHYADEEAIGPLWKGRRFPASACISGWAIIRRQSVVIEDVYADARIPVEAYRPTFVKSLAMVPIRVEDPVGALGAYWSRRHRATPRQLSLLEALAAAAGTAVQNLDLTGRLERAVRLRDELIALAGHELNTPLTAVRLRVDALARGHRVGVAPGEREIERLRGVVDRLSEVVAALGSFSRASSDGIALELAHVELAGVVRAAVEAIGRRARTESTGTAIRVVAPGAVEGEWDGQRLAQAVGHLLDNAVKFGRGAPVEVRVVDDGDAAEVSIRDEGPGIPRTEQDRIFGRFERATSASSHGGLGLGLWLARAIAEAHGGTISVDSAPGAGAVFTLRVPKRLPAG